MRSFTGRPLTKTCSPAVPARARSGGARCASRRSGPRSAVPAERCSWPRTCATRSPRGSTRRNSRATRPSRERTNVTSGRASAAASTTSPTCALSVAVDLRNFFRAGTLKNRSRTSTVVPTAHPAGFTRGGEPPSIDTSVPSSLPPSRVVRRSFDTDATLGSASPRKPKVWRFDRSSMAAILLVAWRSRQSVASAASMPIPSSVTRMRITPPCSISTRTRRAPASSAFSTSSFTTLAGRSTTSPAAIWLARASVSRRIELIAPRSGPPPPRRTGESASGSTRRR